jgi:hypothetical protein
VRLIRSFPATVPAGRSYVVDDAERHLNEGYSYRGLVAYGDDVLHLDWDMAVSREDLELFAVHARRHPDRVLVGPQRVDVGDGRRFLREPVWNMRVYDGPRLRNVRSGEPSCDLFGFGMVYLPGKLLAGFEDQWRPELDEGSVRFDDTGFSGWVWREQGPSAIDWSVHPVHLHYRISEVIR